MTHQELSRDVICQPYAVIGDEEFEAVRMHATGLDPEDGRFAVTLANAARRCLIHRQVHLLPRLRRQSSRQDRGHEPRCSSVIEHTWRLLRRQTEFDGDRVSLGGANALSIIR